MAGKGVGNPVGVRLNRRHQDMVRSKIQASQLINRLQAEALGELELTDGQRDSAKFLVHKILGNAPSVVEGPGDEGEHVIVCKWQE